MPTRRLGIALALLALLSLPACGPSRAATPTAAPAATTAPAAATPTAASAPSAVPTGAPTAEPTAVPPTPTAAPTDTPEPTATLEPAPTLAPVEDIGLSRSAPAPRDATISTLGWEVRVTDFVRGEEAWAMILAASDGNPPAPEGWEYLLVKVHVRSAHEDSEEREMGPSSFFVTGDRLTRYWFASAMYPEPALQTTLTAGDEAEGWVAFLVQQGEGELMLIFNEWMEGWDEDIRYIALDEGASISVDPALGDIQPTEVGASPDAPAPIGEKTITVDWEVTVLETVRGDAAWERLAQESAFNEPPAEGMEYILARLRSRRIGLPFFDDDSDDILTMDASYFTTTGAASVIYEAPWLTPPAPVFEANLYLGGEVEGWAVFQIGIGEEQPVLVFQPFAMPSEGDARYVSLQ